MYKVNIESKTLVPLNETTFSALGLKERFDIQEWIEKTPEILGENLLIIAKEFELPSRTRLDLLAIDKQANLVVIELKRDDSGSNVDWQSIKYASYVSNFTFEEILTIFAEYLGTNEDEAELNIETFIDQELEHLNDSQRIILVSRNFHSDVISAVFWLRDFSLDISCIKLEPLLDKNNDLFLNSITLIPLPEAEDYMKRREKKTKEKSISKQNSFSLEKSELSPEELKKELVLTFSRKSDLTPRLRVFFNILLSENKAFDREDIKVRLHSARIGKDVGQSGRFLSGISQFFTKKSNPHLRQIVDFQSGGSMGETKNNYLLLEEFRELVAEALAETDS